MPPTHNPTQCYLSYSCQWWRWTTADHLQMRRIWDWNYCWWSWWTTVTLSLRVSIEFWTISILIFNLGRKSSQSRLKVLIIWSFITLYSLLKWNVVGNRLDPSLLRYWNPESAAKSNCCFELSISSLKSVNQIEDEDSIWCITWCLITELNRATTSTPWESNWDHIGLGTMRNAYTWQWSR